VRGGEVAAGALGTVFEGVAPGGGGGRVAFGVVTGGAGVPAVMREPAAGGAKVPEAFGTVAGSLVVLVLGAVAAVTFGGGSVPVAALAFCVAALSDWPPTILPGVALVPGTGT